MRGTGPRDLHGPRPRLVACAVRHAAAIGFAHSCRDEVGRLLQLLARGRHVAELGAGAGVGGAWLVSGGPRSLVTVESDAGLARHTATLLGALAEVVHADWTQLLGRPRFDLVFADARAAKYSTDVFDLLAPGGLLVLDDLTPPSRQPVGWDPADDPLRTLVAEHAGAWSEVQVADDHSVLLARHG